MNQYRLLATLYQRSSCIDDAASHLAARAQAQGHAS